MGIALVVAIGLEIVIVVVAGWGISVWENMRIRNSVNESMMVRSDGTPVIQSTSFYSYSGHSYNTVTYRALDGSTVPRPGEKDRWLKGASLTIPHYTGVFPLQGYMRIGRFEDRQSPPAQWYFVDDGARDGRGYFEGFDTENKRRMGFIGRSGLRPDRPPVDDWFPMDGNKLASDAAFTRHSIGPNWMYGENSSVEFPLWKVGMISGGQLLSIDLRNGSVKTLFESADLIAIGLSTVTVSDETPDPNFHQRLAVRTSDRVLLLDGEGKQLTSYLVPEEFRDQGFTLYELETGKALLTVGQPVSYHEYPNDLVWIDTSGKILRREEVLLNGSYYGIDETENARASAVAAPAPVLLAFFAVVIAPNEALSMQRAANYSAALSHSLSLFAVPLLLVSLLSVVLAVICWRRHTHYYQPASGAWFFFVLLTGLPGLVGYLFHRRLPIREACPACRAVVPRDRDACAACGAEFPSPKPKGIEVFA
jgi:hypothetical protein